MAKLTNIACKNAKPKEKTQRLFDGQGLYLEVSPTGGKYWRLKYRYNSKEITIMGTVGKRMGNQLSRGIQQANANAAAVAMHFTNFAFESQKFSI